MVSASGKVFGDYSCSRRLQSSLGMESCEITTMVFSPQVCRMFFHRRVFESLSTKLNGSSRMITSASEDRQRRSCNCLRWPLDRLPPFFSMAISLSPFGASTDGLAPRRLST